MIKKYKKEEKRLKDKRGGFGAAVAGGDDPLAAVAAGDAALEAALSVEEGHSHVHCAAAGCACGYGYSPL